MDSPESSGKEHMENITIPSALVTKRFGDDLRKALQNGDMVNVLLDWRESLPHPDERVEYEFWTNSNDECGAKCDMQMNFVRSFRGIAQALEKRGYTQFTPHYITWYCPEAFVLSKQCKSQCINHGRYCAPDPEQDFSIGYDGKDVVLQNLIQICVFTVGNESRKPWMWWDYVHDFAVRCPMKEKKYTRECANDVIKSLGGYCYLYPSEFICCYIDGFLIIQKKPIYLPRTIIHLLFLQDWKLRKSTSVLVILMPIKKIQSLKPNRMLK